MAYRALISRVIRPYSSRRPTPRSLHHAAARSAGERGGDPTLRQRFGTTDRTARSAAARSSGGGSMSVRRLW